MINSNKDAMIARSTCQDSGVFVSISSSVGYTISISIVLNLLEYISLLTAPSVLKYSVFSFVLSQPTSCLT